MNTTNKIYKLNRMALTIQKLESYLPKTLHKYGYTFIFNNMVKLAGTSKLQVEQMSNRYVKVNLKNHKKIQNHIGSLHACSMVLAAESATGIIIGMNVPDTHIPLIKSMNVNFIKRCQGDITAIASINDNDYKRINEEDRGDISVNVSITDESNNEPIKAEMIWAWINKSHLSKSKSKSK